MPNIGYRCCSRAKFGQGFFRQPLLPVSALPRSPQLADAPLHPRSGTTVLGEGCPPCSVGARWVHRLAPLLAAAAPRAEQGQDRVSSSGEPVLPQLKGTRRPRGAGGGAR